jgi:hypothetical protein
MLLRGLARAVLPLGLAALCLAEAGPEAWFGAAWAFCGGMSFAFGILEE